MKELSVSVQFPRAGRQQHEKDSSLESRVGEHKNGTCCVGCGVRTKETKRWIFSGGGAKEAGRVAPRLKSGPLYELIHLLTLQEKLELRQEQINKLRSLFQAVQISAKCVDIFPVMRGKRGRGSKKRNNVRTRAERESIVNLLGVVSAQKKQTNKTRKAICVCSNRTCVIALHLYSCVPT